MKYIATIRRMLDHPGTRAALATAAFGWALPTLIALAAEARAAHTAAQLELEDIRPLTLQARIEAQMAEDQLRQVRQCVRDAQAELAELNAAAAEARRARKDVDPAAALEEALADVKASEIPVDESPWREKLPA